MANRVFLGRYQAIRLLGEGGMGQVFLARQLDQDRLVAVKVLHRHLVSDAHHREAFRREINFMARFRHPGAIELYEASMDDPQGPTAVMELVEGITLVELLERHGRLAPERVGRLLGQLCAVLQAAHDRNIIHRDLKPANIQVVSADTPAETVKVLDFGLARLALAPGRGPYIAVEKLTASSVNAAVGTPEYSCPEQLNGDEVDHRGDIYSVGIILYELLTGKRPFDGTIDEVVEAHRHMAPPPFASRGVHTISSDIEDVVICCLAKNPKNRPPSARDLARVFGRVLGQSIWDEGAEASTAPAEIAPPAPAIAHDSRSPFAVTYRMQAWMPERIAAMKLRGFLSDYPGEVLESRPGLVRLSLRRGKPAAKVSRTGLWSLLGLGKKPEPQQAENVYVDVFMRTKDNDANHLDIMVRIHPAEGAPRGPHSRWRSWCDEILLALNGYLMAKRCT
jgi:serine/threonine-protein kinase